jgi:hypothetical protein
MSKDGFRRRNGLREGHAHASSSARLRAFR